MPRDRDGSFDPVIVRERQRGLNGIDELVLSLTARGLTTGKIAAHFNEVYGAKVSKDTISRITDKVLAEMTEWCQQPLDRVYPVLRRWRGLSEAMTIRRLRWPPVSGGSARADG
jgi:putative transposase